MSSTSPEPKPGSSTGSGSLQSQIDRLTSQRARIDRDLAALRRRTASSRPWYDCLRCGHRWQGRSLDRSPRFCSRCHSAGWNSTPKLASARTPAQSPNPKWNRKRQPTPTPTPTPSFDRIGNVPIDPATIGQPSTVLYLRTERNHATLEPRLEPMEPLLGLPAIGLPPLPQLDAPRLQLPRIEPMGESAARPSAPSAPSDDYEMVIDHLKDSMDRTTESTGEEEAPDGDATQAATDPASPADPEA